MRINQRFNRDISKIWQSGQVVKVGLCLLFMISAPFCLSDVFSATGAEAPLFWRMRQNKRYRRKC